MTDDLTFDMVCNRCHHPKSKHGPDLACPQVTDLQQALAVIEKACALAEWEMRGGRFRDDGSWDRHVNAVIAATADIDIPAIHAYLATHDEDVRRAERARLWKETKPLFGMLPPGFSRDHRFAVVWDAFHGDPEPVVTAPLLADDVCRVCFHPSHAYYVCTYVDPVDINPERHDCGCMEYVDAEAESKIVVKVEEVPPNIRTTSEEEGDET